MKNCNISLLAIALGSCFSTATFAQGLSELEYKDGKVLIASNYSLDQAPCEALAGNEKDICQVDAKGREAVALAELEVGYKPSSENRYQLRVAKAQAEYAVTIEHCDDFAGNVKDVCIKEAKAVNVAASADAQAQMKIYDANVMAKEKTTDARRDANEASAEARAKAMRSSHIAQYKLAKEKCDSYSGDAKDSCMTQAKSLLEE